MSLAEKFKEYYTYKDYKTWKGDWELIEGIPFAMSPSPSVKHQLILSKLIYLLNKEFKKNKCKKCFVLPETDWVISFDTVVRPDISIVCHLENFEDYINRTPEVIFEIVSPSSYKRDERLKFELYKKEGVKFYILVYPDLKLIKAYKFENGNVIFLKIQDNILEISLDNNCSFKIDINELFEN